ncbi:MAG: hypothetical protein ACOWWM_15645 [Desulfobacterales bacterium]
MQQDIRTVILRAICLRKVLGRYPGKDMSSVFRAAPGKGGS